MSNDKCDHDDHHTHQTPGSPLEPAVDARTGKLEQHCTRCGASIASGEEFCQICALEADGGEAPPDQRRGE